MIKDDTQFEAALDAATRRLARPPADGSPEHDRFINLLRDIAAWRPTVQAGVTGGVDDKRARLASKLDAFETQIAPHYGPHWRSMIGGDVRPDSPRGR